MNIVLEIIWEPSSHAIPDARHRARRYRKGDIVDVLRPARVGAPGEINATGRLAYIRVSGVPDTIPFARIKHRLTEKIEPGDLPAPPPDLPPDQQPPEDLTIHERLQRIRKWRIVPSELPNPRRNQLNNNRDTSMNWNAVKNALKRKLVVNRDDAAQDDETVSITDGEI